MKRQEIGKYLKQCREANAIAQRDVSQALGWTSAQFVSNIERGLCSPPLKSIRKYARLVGASEKRLRGMLIDESAAHIKKAFGG